jgi:cephalosporin-C deacetylase
MRQIEKQVRQLQAIDVPSYKEADFDEFWDRTVATVEAAPLEVSDEVIEYPLPDVEVHDLRFAGLDGTPVAAWYLRPTQVRGPCPVIVEFHGGNGSRGCPLDHSMWLLAGYAVVTMDFRQQGGITGSRTAMDRCGNGHWICGNLEQPHNHYLYHAWTDALLCVRVAETRLGVRPDQVIVSGVSQGGGTAIMAAALNPRVALCLSNVPSFCWWERRIETGTACASTIADYIHRYPAKAETVFRTMSYYDVLHFAGRVRCPLMGSVGLKDTLTPPDCVFAGFNKVTSEKRIEVYPFGGHERRGFHIEKELAWMRAHLAT